MRVKFSMRVKRVCRIENISSDSPVRVKRARARHSRVLRALTTREWMGMLLEDGSIFHKTFFRFLKDFGPQGITGKMYSRHLLTQICQV